MTVWSSAGDMLMNRENEKQPLPLSPTRNDIALLTLLHYK